MVHLNINHLHFIVFIQKIIWIEKLSNGQNLSEI